MKLGEIKKLQKGDVIAYVTGISAPERVVVARVEVRPGRAGLVRALHEVKSTNMLRVIGENGKDYYADMIQAVTPAIEDRWRRDQEREDQGARIKAEAKLVAEVLGVEPRFIYGGWGQPPRDFELSLNRESLLALVERLQKKG